MTARESTPAETRSRRWVIFTDEGNRRLIIAPSLRTALRKFEKDDPAAGQVIAAVEAHCLPTPSDEALPFLAVMLKNPRYSEPEV